MMNNNIINLDDEKLVSQKELFCINCGKAILLVYSKDRYDLEKQSMQCPVCKKDMQLFKEVCFDDVLNLISKIMRNYHKKKYNYQFPNDKEKEMFILGENLINYVEKNINANRS
ncbi:MAG: hypothetical protein BV456_00075 [Thermoplasmata archaeon M8B2D]|nr:MAG: hypothetical protein BV456_00075 [Thermoplasmata archaeon M8B2D]